MRAAEQRASVRWLAGLSGWCALLWAGVAAADAPTAAGSSVSTNENQAVGVTLQGADLDRDSLRFSLVSNPGHGSLSCGFTAGCTSIYAFNYDANADTDNGSCQYSSCLQILRANPSATSGSYSIDPDGLGPRGAVTVYCDMDTDGGGYTYHPISGGIQTFQVGDWNSCRQLGMEIAIPRTKAHYTRMFQLYGSSYFQIAPGISKPTSGGDFRGFPMNSRNVPPNTWRASDGGSWWLRDTPFSEPNGDYTGNCWLLMYNHNPDDIQFNDANCGYSATNYICSTNDKDGPGSLPRPGSCADILRANPSAGSGNYTIYRGGTSLVAYCDMTTDGGGYTYYPVAGGIRTYRSLDNNTCKALGMDIAIPRTREHFQAMYARYGAGYFQIIPGVHKRSGGGNYTGVAMNDLAMPAGGYEAIDGGSWWVRDAAYSEPNGDYQEYCWLGAVNASDINNVTFNDGTCSYYADNYICSPNDKDGPVAKRHPYSCAEIKRKNPSAPSGNYDIQPGEKVISAYCDMTTDGGGYTLYPVDSGKRTYRSTDDNTCKDLGMDVVIPRTKNHWGAMIGRYGTSYFDIIPGISKPTGGGNYTGCAMQKGNAHCDQWRALDGGGWWLRDTTYVEPNGDYTANCWLGVNPGYNVSDINNLTFNDGSCSYSAIKYLCSTNDKDGALGPWGEFKSCADAKRKVPSAASGIYIIDVDGPEGLHRPTHVYCDMTTDGGGYTYREVNNGTRTYRSTDIDDCKKQGMQLVVPRSQNHWTSLLARYDTSYFATIPGVSRLYNAGSFTHIPMKYDSAFRNGTWQVGEPWSYQAIDGGSWWVRDSTYGEPSGDYEANCWLGMFNWAPNNLTFNDGGCAYSSARYVCAVNDKDLHGDFPNPPAIPQKTQLSCTYTPTTNYSGGDSFVFRVTDTYGGSATATVNVTVINSNAPPSAQAQALSLGEDSNKALTLGATDPDNDPLTYTIIDGVDHGTLSCAGASCTYTPAANYNGSDAFVFRVTDPSGLTSDAAVTLTVTAVNDAPVANAGSASVAEDNTVAVTLSGSDVEGSPLSYTITAQPSHGSLSGTAPNLTYTPAANYNGPDSFTFRVSDGALSSADATVTLNVTAVNDAPVANAGSALTAEDAATTFTLSASDADGDALTWAVVGGVAHGSLTCAANTCTYTPAANYNGLDSFTFRVNDGAVNSNTATFSLTVQAVNDAPVASNASVTTAEDVATGVTLSANDVDGDGLTWTILTQPSRGTLTGTAPNLTYTPNPNFGGGDSFNFRVSDGSANSNVATVTITIDAVNDAPVALPQTVGAQEDAASVITLAAVDTEGDALSYAISAQPAHGSLTCAANTCTYTPAANYNGPDSFTFYANDGALGSNVATVTINVAAVNDAPTTSDISRVINDGQPVALTLVADDVDMDALTWTITTSPSHGTLSGTAPDLTYTPTPGYAGADGFAFTVSDGQAQASGVGMLQISNQTLDPPVVTIATPGAWQRGVVAFEGAVTDVGCSVAPAATLTPAVAPLTVTATMSGWAVSTGALPQDRYTVTLTVTSACSNKSSNASQTFGVDNTPAQLNFAEGALSQVGVNPNDSATWPTLTELDGVALTIQLIDLPSGKASGNASVSATLRELDNDDNDITLHALSFDGRSGSPPSAPPVAGGQMCQEGGVCADNQVVLGELEGDRFRLTFSAQDLAGNATTREYYFRRAQLRPSLVAWINAVGGVSGDGPASEALRQQVEDKLDAALLAYDEGQYGNLLLALEDAEARMREARALDPNLDSGPQALLVARVAYGFYSARLASLEQEHGPDEDFEQAALYMDEARLNALNNASGDALLSMANAWFWMTQGASPLEAIDYGSTQTVIQQILGEMDEYITHDPALPGQAQLAQARTTLSTVEEFITRIVQNNDLSLTDLEHVRLLIGLTDTAEFLKSSEEQTIWIRNWQWGLTQIVYIYANRGLNNAAIFLGNNSNILADGRAQLANALQLREDYKADDFMNLLIASRCLILGLYNAAYNPDEAIPQGCCEDIVRYHDLEPAVPVPNHCVQTTACAAVTEGQTANLSCGPGQTIASISFASYGLPNGSCEAYQVGGCHASSSVSAVQSLCVGEQSCDVPATNATFGDPCGGIGKRLYLQAVCQ